MASTLPIPAECCDCDIEEDVSPPVFSTLVDMRSGAEPADDAYAVLLGTSAEFDAGRAFYQWDAASVAADNGTTVVALTEVTGAGRYLRL